MIPREYTDQHDVTSAFGQLDAKKAQAQKREYPVNQAYANFIQRLMDPNADASALGREAAAHPEVRAYIESLKQGMSAAPAPQDQIPQVGSVGGQTSIGAPGQFEPAHGPNGPGGGNPQPKYPGYPAGPPTGEVGTGYNAPPPENPWERVAGNASPAFQAANPEQGQGMSKFVGQHQQAAQAIQPSQPMSAYSRSLAETGPAQGAPQVSPQEAGAQGWSPGQPQETRGTSGPPPWSPPSGHQYGPPNQFPPAQFSPNSDVLYPRDLEQMQHALPSIIASQGREQVAQTNTQGKGNVAAGNQEVQLILGKLKALGMSDATIARLRSETAKEVGRNQRFVESEKNDLTQTGMMADATKSAAGTRAATKESPAEKELRTIETEMGAITSKPDWTKDQQSVQNFNRLWSRVGELHRQVGREGNSTPPPMQPVPEQAKTILKGQGIPTPSGKPAPKPPQPQQGKKIRVMKNGVAGTIDESKFDPSTMTKI